MELTRTLELVIKQLPSQFTLKGSKITTKDILSETGLLPGLARRADQLASLCLGYGLGIKVEDEEKSLLGSKVSFDEFTPNVIRVLCIVDVLQEIVGMSSSSSEVSLDELMYD